jgi:hypothetical protein
MSGVRYVDLLVVSKNLKRAKSLKLLAYSLSSEILLSSHNSI